MIRKTLLSLALTAAVGGVATAQEDYATWGSMRVLSVAPSGITEGVGKFPLLVRLTSAHADVFTNSKGRGADIRFTKADLATRYQHQIERWDSVGQKAEIWVLVDSVRTGNTLNVKMLWNKAGAADSSKGSAVFSASNGFVSVLHLGDSTGTNPRPNQVAGAPTGILRHFDEDQDHGPRTYAPVEGVIALADELRGGGMMASFYPGRDYIDLGRRSYAGFSDFTTGFFFSTWFNVTNTVQYERFLEMNDDTVGTGSSEERIILFGNHTTAPQNVSVRWGAGGLAYNESNGGLYIPGEWAHIAFSKAPGSAPISIYVNGTLVPGDDERYAEDPVVAMREYVALGRPSVTQGDPFFTGILDESILAKVARSASWIKLTYETQKPASTALTVGATATPAAGGEDYTVVSLAGSAGRFVHGFSARTSGRQVVFGLPAAASAGRVTVVDVWGRVLWTRNVEAGTTTVSWDGRGPAGAAARGVYVARFETKGASVDRKFTFNP